MAPSKPRADVRPRRPRPADRLDGANPELQKRDPLSQAIRHVAAARDAVAVHMAQGGAAVNLADDFLRIAETQLEEARERRRRGTI